MSELKNCPFCGGEVSLDEIEPHKHLNGILPDHPGSWFIECSCGVGMIGEDKQDVIDRWNRRNAPDPHKLTLDELRQMDGMPIWTETIGVEGSGRWEIMTFTTIHVCPFEERITMVCLDEGQEDYKLDTYGRTWIAYDRPPGGAK